jgi:uracil-DNA glycosylase
MLDGLLDAVLAVPSTALATNFYLADSDSDGDFRTNATERRDRLHAHLRRVSGGDLVVVGEAPGWKGARQSGVPFTSANAVGLQGVSTEASATIVQGMLAALGIAESTLLWNAFPLHPHHAGVPRTNRTPTVAELDSGMDSLRLAVAGRRVICVGGKARSSVEEVLGVEVPDIAGVSSASPGVAIRHPSNGGARLFRSQLAAVGALWGLT